MLRFNLDIDVMATKWKDEEQRKEYIKNFTDVVEKGLMKMTVPNWEVKNVTVEEIDDFEIIDYKLDCNGHWYGLFDDGSLERDWRPVRAFDVPLKYLIGEYEYMVIELSDKEAKYSELKETYDNREFEIVYMSDIDFKELYGSTSEKVRKQHAKTELSDISEQLTALQLSIDWLKRYTGFLRELIRCKGE